MEFMQLGLKPGTGIPDTDSYCFGKYFTKHTRSDLDLYKFRDHTHSNHNEGGWVVRGARRTTFNLKLIF